MGYTYTLTDFYRIKENEKEYEWPCGHNRCRLIKLLRNDILTVQSKENNICNVIKHTGLMCTGIIVPEEDLELFHEVVEIGTEI